MFLFIIMSAIREIYLWNSEFNSVIITTYENYIYTILYSIMCHGCTKQFGIALKL